MERQREKKKEEAKSGNLVRGWLNRDCIALMPNTALFLLGTDFDQHAYLLWHVTPCDNDKGNRKDTS